jgi:hypothetical protein
MMRREYTKPKHRIPDRDWRFIKWTGKVGGDKDGQRNYEWETSARGDE